MVLTQLFFFVCPGSELYLISLLSAKIVSRELISIGVEMIVLIQNKQDCTKHGALDALQRKDALSSRG